MFADKDEDDRRLSEQMLSNLQHLEAALLRQAGRSLRSEVSSPSVALTDEQVDPNQEEVESNYNLYDLPRSLQELLERAESMRKVRRGAKKRNYNLDHLARMNFRRSFRASSLNNRHILGGL
ncbi:uncharacterized protein LOC131893627 isoform X2 [Tigriopus californicus]|uniref:uncharacterized protein LOC131893627 isoform X2 n=1 Tax=Tigriopus californicus TaxID=6832 RepID=UPI0027DA6D9C|nr:uncharacterized protein LOC131893627 isoform X2 [Tigriopus californicus]